MNPTMDATMQEMGWEKVSEVRTSPRFTMAFSVSSRGMCPMCRESLPVARSTSPTWHCQCGAVYQISGTGFTKWWEVLLSSINN